MPAGNPTTVDSVLYYDNKVNWIEYLEVVNWIVSMLLGILLSSMKSKVIDLVTIPDGQVHITHDAASARLQMLAFLVAFFAAASLGFLWPVVNVNWHWWRTDTQPYCPSTHWPQGFHLVTSPCDLWTFS